METGCRTDEKRTVQYEWYNDGIALKKKLDEKNNLATEYAYDDAGRQTLTMESSGSSGLRGTWTEYDAANRTVTVKSDLKPYVNGLPQDVVPLQVKTHYDQLGRVSWVQQTDGSALTGSTYANGNGIKLKTIEKYPAILNGVVVSGERVTITTTPHRSLNDPTLEWSCTEYDTLERITLVSTFNAEPTSCALITNRTGATQMAYDVEWTTITDPAGKVRKQRVDVLGRLVEVVEDPNGLNYSTAYTYDALDNLTKVTQGGQIRTFTYSSLSRLLTAVNPESGTTSYTYHDSGDLVNHPGFSGGSII